MDDPRDDQRASKTATEPPRSDPEPEVPEERLVEISAQYEIFEQIGRGGVGRILRAWDKRLDRDVVMKVPIRIGENARFAREALVTAQLEHPAVVPVHAVGKLPNGTPFYVMKLVAGRSLRDEIASQKSLADRLSLLPVMIAVCEAIAYAHSKRIIHRDLKPHNVLVGKFGEATVIDWGMAKRLGVEDDDYVLRESGFLVGDEAHTKTGAVLGTPAYMAPEQARGEVVDQRADVYALGAMLYHLFSGEKPYAGTSSKDILRAVIAGPPAGLETKQPHLAAALLAIVRKALARDPSARYPSARELADDLKRFQTGRLVAAHVYSPSALLARWLLKYRAAVAVGAVALMLLAVLGSLAIRRVVAERNRAERQRVAAEDLVDFMLVDLMKRLRQLGKLALLDGVAGKVDRYYRTLLETSGALDDAASKRQAQALAALGKVRESQGDIAAALEAQSASLAISRRLAAWNPESDERWRDVTVALAVVAQLDVDLGKVDAARAMFEEAIALIAVRLGGSSSRPWLQQRASLLALLANLESVQGHHDKATALFREAAQIQGALAKVEPDNEDLARDLVYSHSRLARRLSISNRHENALSTAMVAQTVAERFSNASPSDIEWRLRLTNSEVEVAEAFQRMGRFAAAIAVLKRVCDVRQGVLSLDPENQERQYGVVEAQTLLASAQGMDEATDQARESIQKAIAGMEHLAAKEPRKRRWRHWLYHVYSQAADIDRDARPPVALSWFQRARDVIEQLIAEDEGNGLYREELAHTLRGIGEQQIGAGDIADAISNLTRSIEIFEQRLRDEPSNRGNALHVAGAHFLLAKAFTKQGKIDPALEHLRAAARFGEENIRQVPERTPQHVDLARSYAAMGRLFMERRHDVKSARESFQRAREILTRLEDEHRLPADSEADRREVEAALQKLR